VSIDKPSSIPGNKRDISVTKIQQIEVHEKEQIIYIIIKH
jgi:hypothetical protein